MRMLYMEYPNYELTESTTKFKVGEEVIWECEEDQIYLGKITNIGTDIQVYFPEIKAFDTFYLDGKYTKFDKGPAITKALIKGRQQ